MLEPFSFLKSLFPDVQMEYTADILCHIFHYYIQQDHDESFQHYMLVLPLMGIYFRRLIFIHQG